MVQAPHLTSMDVDASHIERASSGPPPRPAEFVERAQTHAEVVAALLSAHGRVVLQGLGGSGKTWLAIDIANYLSDIGESDAVVWATARDHPLTAEGFLRGAARALGSTDVAAQPRDILPAAVWDLLAERRTLIVVDNFETIATADQHDLLTLLGTTGASTRVLITSRHTDFLTRSEQVLRDWGVVHVRGMSLDETRALLTCEADRAGATFLNPPPPAAVEQIRRVTDGLPAAVRWIVSQSRRKPLGEVLTSVAMSREGPGPTLVRRSYEMLQPDGLAILRAACVPEGPVSTAALTAIVGITDLAAQRALADLKDLGLVERRGERRGGGALLGVHPLVRGFVLGEMRAEAGLEDALIGRAVAHYVDFVRLNGGFQNPAGQEDVATELEAILGLAELLYRRQGWGELLDLIRPLNNLLWMRGFWRERLHYGRMARETAAQLDDVWSEGEILSGDLGWTYRQLGELDAAYACLVDAVPLLERAGDFEELANAWRYLAQVARDRGDIDGYRAHLEQSLRVAEQLDDPRRVYSAARTCLDLGYLAVERGQLAEAQQAFTVAADVFAASGDEVRRAIALSGLGDIAAREGDVGVAQHRYRESLELARRFRSVADQGRALLRLAQITANSDSAAARRHALVAREVFETAGMAPDAARASALTSEIDAVPPTLRLDTAVGRVWVRGNEVRLAPQEFDLLRLLADHAGQICTHAEVCATLFPGTTLPLPTLMAQVHPLVFHLRQALERDPKRPEILLSKYGMGYLLSIPTSGGVHI